MAAHFAVRNSSNI